MRRIGGKKKITRTGGTQTGWRVDSEWLKAFFICASAQCYSITRNQCLASVDELTEPSYECSGNQEQRTLTAR